MAQPRYPLTTNALKDAGVKFSNTRSETAAGYIEHRAFSISARGEKGEILNWLMIHRNSWPVEWNDAAVAARLPAILSKFAPLAAAARAANDRARYQEVLREAQTSLFE